MKGLKLTVKGNWAQFKRPETSNNPLSHDFITKTAMIGMIGAVLGKDRATMKTLFPVLSEDLKYGVQINNEVKKQSWGFTFRQAGNDWSKAPKQMEFLRNPDYLIILCLVNERSAETFNEFVQFCKEEKACYQPVLGLHNCPAEIIYQEEGDIEYVSEGVFETKGFVTNKHKLESFYSVAFRLGFDKMPTFQNEDFWNLPDKYISIIYPSENNKLKIKGDYYIFNSQSCWYLI
jgi:CRISPR-associated protein Cas5 subtype I-B